MTRSADARAVALDLLAETLDRGRPLDQAMAAHAGMATLEPRDRAFARLLVATTLRRLGQIDALLHRCLARPLPPRAGPVLHILRLGAAQLLFLGTPPHAAVDSTVALASGAALAGFRGLVNAVLRRLDREARPWVAAQDEAVLNLPDWLLQSWTKAYGEERARAIAALHLREPPTDFAVPADPGNWAAALGGFVLPTGAVRRSPEAGGGAIEALPGYAEGAWWVQDAAAQLPVRLFGDVAGREVLDLCAAPGGKTAQLAAGGARVTAVDHDAERLRRVALNMARLRLTARLVEADITRWRPERPAEFVLLDAPCSATGTIRRHPDVPWQKNPETVRRLAAAQDRMLAAAVEMTAPGGTLVYCVCSLQPEEGAERIAAFLAAGAPVERRPLVAGEIAGLPADAITVEGDLRTLPDEAPESGGWDGFYAARLVRRG